MAKDRHSIIEQIQDTGVSIEERKLYLFGEVDSELADKFIKNLHFLQKANKETGEELHVYINSAGGDVDDGMAIFNAIRVCPLMVNAHILGHAHSMAAIITQACDHRIMYQGAKMLVHNGSVSLELTVDDALQHAKMSKDEINMIYNILHARIVTVRPNVTLKKVKAFFTGDKWLTADAALEWGLIDEIK